MRQTQLFHFTIDGRIGRAQFWLGVLMLCLVQFGLVALFTVLLSSVSGRASFSTTIAGINAFLSLLLIWPSFCLNAKRFHDLNMSAWWCLLGLIPYLGILILLILLGFVEGSYGKNRFGNNPLDPKDFRWSKVPSHLRSDVRQV